MGLPGKRLKSLYNKGCKLTKNILRRVLSAHHAREELSKKYSPCVKDLDLSPPFHHTLLAYSFYRVPKKTCALCKTLNMVTWPTGGLIHRMFIVYSNDKRSMVPESLIKTVRGNAFLPKMRYSNRF